MVRKTFHFDTAAAPFIDFSSSVENAGQPLDPTIVWGPGVGSGLNTSGRSYYTPPEPIATTAR